MTKIYRDSTGHVINIGEWDYMLETFTDPATGEESIITHNPLPDGTHEDEAEVIEMPDGGLKVVE